jgi:hypothetical protein
MKRLVFGHDNSRGACCAWGRSPSLRRLCKWLIALLLRSIVSRAWSLEPARRQAGSLRRPEGAAMRTGLPRRKVALEIVTDYWRIAHD